MFESGYFSREKFLFSILALQVVGSSFLIEKVLAKPTDQIVISPELAKLLAELKAQDTCQTIYTSTLHGYDVQRHRVVTSDGYELVLHRLVHPSDRRTNGPRPGTKKPYLLLHGLIGSSASFVRHVEPNFKAKEQIFDASDAVDQVLKQRLDHYEAGWQSTADWWHASFQGDTSRTLEDLTAKEKLLGRTDRISKPFAGLNDIDFDGDTTNFGREFKQAHRKFQLPRDAKPFVSNSLAFTMSNFGYDVWLLNLRGNQYSRAHHGRLSAGRDEYWDFDVDKLIKEDLMASINHVREVAKSDKFGPTGLISYSYSSMHVMGLLTKFPNYQKYLQPVVLMAPTMFTAKSGKTRYLMKLTKKFVSHNGPFPALGRGAHDKLMKLICSLPLASKLCNLLEMVIHGESKSVRKLLFDDQKSSMVKRDVDCGQTSTAVLHKILENLSESSISFDYRPFVAARNMLMKGERVRRSVILLHSESDEISSSEEVAKIRDSALNLMTLVDYVIKDANFGHTDFLFSKRNQFMVNAEIVRMASLYDHLMYLPSSNRQVQRPRGY